jgi:type IV secretion system protein VirD4
MSPDSIARRRPDPLPWSWEVPAGAAVAWLSLAAGTLLAAQGAAGFLTGQGWLWPSSPRLFPALGGLLTGQVGVGVDAPAGLPSTPLVYALALGLELALLAVSVWSAVRFWTTVGPGRRYGMATRADAETILGVGRLRRVRTLIRPDLYGRPVRRSSPVSVRWSSLAGQQLSKGPAEGVRHAAVAAGDDAGRGKGRARFVPASVGWRLGVGKVPRTGPLWVPFDRTTGVYGPQGSGKTLDLLTPALLGAPGAALVTLTKVEDLLLTIDHRSTGGRPVAVLDPFGLAPGMPELVWDPVAGCVDSMVAERRAKAFTAGTVKGAVAQGSGDSAARFYAAEGAKVLQAYFHAAALTGRTIEDVLEWVANPRAAAAPEEILRSHPNAAPFWHGLLHGALHGDDRTAGNTSTTVQQAMALFFQASLRARCTPGPGRPATDLTDLITRGGTIYLLGRDDPYASASPLLAAIAEHVLDTALAVATASPFGRLCPSFLACLDELPSTAPLPTLRTRMANERALGLSFIYAAQTWRQLVICYGEDEARALFGLTNVIAVFGGGKDGIFNRELSELLGTSRVSRTTYNRGRGNAGTSYSGVDEPILRPEEIRLLPERHTLVIAENAKPLIAKLTRCVDGNTGRALLTAQAAAAGRVATARDRQTPMLARTTAAVQTAHQLDLSPAATAASPTAVPTPAGFGGSGRRDGDVQAGDHGDGGVGGAGGGDRSW